MQIRLTIQGRSGPEVHALEARDEADAVRIATAKGWHVVGLAKVERSRSNRSSRFDLVLFAQELLALLE
ncbi:MAG: hypothetical protein JNN20_19850, partial [Betaproteobacteria bacterium]|nr:hypothetical protein [Betaproteobacteria bacterium]